MTGLAVTSRSGAVLKTPIAREDWELKNDDVQLVEKIGRGNFGDVYKGGLISENFFDLGSKLYIPSTLNIDLILWHTQLIVCAENVKSWFKSWVFPFTIQAYTH